VKSEEKSPSENKKWGAPGDAVASQSNRLAFGLVEVASAKRVVWKVGGDSSGLQLSSSSLCTSIRADERSFSHLIR
jgi:hypothetical protein